MSEAFAARRNPAASAPVRPSRRPSPRGPKLLRRNRAPASSGTGLYGHWAFRALTFRGPPAGAGARKPPGKFGAAGGAQGGATGQSKGLQYSIFVYGRNGFCASGSRVRDVVSHLRRDAGPGFESNGVNSYIGEGNFGCWVVALGSSGRSSTSTPRDAWARALIAQRPPATCSVWPET